MNLTTIIGVTGEICKIFYGKKKPNGGGTGHPHWVFLKKSVRQKLFSS
jgi:hypothetical protein